MRRRTQNDSVWGHVTAYGSEIFWVPTIIVAVFGWFVATMTYCSVVSDQNDLRESQFQVVHVLEDIRYFGSGDSVKEVAKNLLWTYEVGLGVSELKDEDFRNEVITSSQTGSVPQVTTPRKTWDEFLPGEGDFLTSWLSLGLLATLALISCAGSLCYANECSDNREFIADLNLRKPAHVLFALCTPLLWPFYPISLMGMYFDTRRRRIRNREVRAVETSTGQFDLNGDVMRRLTDALDSIESMSEPPEVFVDDRAGALEVYYRICSDLAIGNVDRRKERLSQEIEDLGQKAADLSKAMRSTTQKRTKAKADLRMLESLDPADSVPNRETAETQFNRLVALAGVNEVWPIENGIGLVVKARLSYEGERYDLGDWKLLVTDSQVEAHEIRKGTLPEWPPYEYPSYRYGQGRFCFGTRHPEMNDRCQSGHLLEAAIIAVECLNSVNEKDLKKVPKAFKRASD